MQLLPFPLLCCPYPPIVLPLPAAGYIGSVLFTLYASLMMKSYVLSLFCSGLQVVALLYYLTSYYPGGTGSVKFLLTMFGSAASSCFSACTTLVFGAK
jgi:hypothetical protein